MGENRSDFHLSVRAVLSRLESATAQYGTVWDEGKVMDAISRQYRLLNVPMPPVKVVGNLGEAFRETYFPTAEADAYADVYMRTYSSVHSMYHAKVLSMALSRACWDARAAAYVATLNELRRMGVRTDFRSPSLSATYSTIEVVVRWFVSDFSALFEATMDALEAGLGWYIALDKRLILVPMPLLRLDETGRLHSDTAPAVEWRDGTGYHLLHGVRFDAPLWNRVVSQEMTFADTLALKDIEQRTQAMKYSEPDSFFAHTSADLLDTFTKRRPDGSEVTYALYRVPRSAGLFDDDTHFVLYEDSSPTGRTYLSGVPKFDTIPDAMAWKASDLYSAEEWKSIVPLQEEA